MSLITNTIDHTQGTVHHVGMSLKKKTNFTYQGSFPKARKLLKHSLADQKSIYPSARNHFSLFSNLLNIIWYNWYYTTVFVARSSYHWPGFLVDKRKLRKSVFFSCFSLIIVWMEDCMQIIWNQMSPIQTHLNILSEQRWCAVFNRPHLVSKAPFNLSHLPFALFC